MQKVMLL